MSHPHSSVVAPGPGSESGPKLFVTGNPDVLRLLRSLDRLAATRATALILGESGTGKEVLAHVIHYRSPRRNRPFIRVNCGALPEGMLESELFGHERGAFTGALRQRPGRFELAHEGTIFLDEIGAADEKVQLRLLRILQEREFERVGGTQTFAVDVRVIAATNVDLRGQVARGGFREDLFYRLNVVPLSLPPLRRRPEDIPLLIDHFLRRHAVEGGGKKREIAPAATERLAQYPWPGNVRELENVVERMLIFVTGHRLEASDIPQEILNWREEEEEEPEDYSFQAARTHFERQYLREALRRHNGVISKAARAIGMSRKNLYMRLGDLHIDYNAYRQ